MEILSIMNGAADSEIREKIKRFALLKGFLTWTPETGPGKAGAPHKTVLAITDMEGAEVYKRDMERLYKKRMSGSHTLFQRESNPVSGEKQRIGSHMYFLQPFFSDISEDSFRKHSGGCNEKPKILFWKAADGEKAASSYRRRQRTENRTL